MATRYYPVAKIECELVLLVFRIHPKDMTSRPTILCFKSSTALLMPKVVRLLFTSNVIDAIVFFENSRNRLSLSDRQLRGTQLIYDGLLTAPYTRAPSVYCLWRFSPGLISKIDTMLHPIPQISFNNQKKLPSNHRYQKAHLRTKIRCKKAF